MWKWKEVQEVLWKIKGGTNMKWLVILLAVMAVGCTESNPVGTDLTPNDYYSYDWNYELPTYRLGFFGDGNWYRTTFDAPIWKHQNYRLELESFAGRYSFSGVGLYLPQLEEQSDLEMHFDMTLMKDPFRPCGGFIRIYSIPLETGTKEYLLHEINLLNCNSGQSEILVYLPRTWKSLEIRVYSEMHHTPLLTIDNTYIKRGE
jgi:hypothetical protein